MEFRRAASKVAKRGLMENLSSLQGCAHDLLVSAFKSLERVFAVADGEAFDSEFQQGNVEYTGLRMVLLNSAREVALDAGNFSLEAASDGLDICGNLRVGLVVGHGNGFATGARRCQKRRITG